ncbi:nitrilase-related carbon-nitrogen hydrolase [Stakelama tenebrarum]|uniref:Carbon-nitrogen hydrolase family protein n=1 Tax=Stakelama tenebrarum TaxID=2711215 RepID=A0A6G6Y9V0_9SPHN|nr:nitrilase-related carbon-nitrogen hydrolase [Sphingosinithalassobacter tenebrarum]QIG81621.1 carbon-nitrogen hydrolase family protein [Sphingosinithalassobacter tenebrarum]
MTGKIRAAIVQDAPLPLAIDQGIERAVGQVKAAIETGAKVIAFGECFLGGYPAWLQHLPGPSLWDHPGTRDLHKLLLDRAIRGADPRFEQLQWVVDVAGVAVSIGGIERVRSSLYNTQFLLRPKEAPLLHRKLLPAPPERMLFGAGDGSTLETHQAPWGRVGQLISGEHWMPLARAAMHHAGEDVHVSAWTTIRDIDLLAACHYAYEGRAFVLAAGTVQNRDDILHGFAQAGGEGRSAARELLDRLPAGALQTGGSAIIAPDGVVLAQAGEEPQIVTADLDLSEIDDGLTSMDIDGRHSRPDVFELRVDRRKRSGIVDIDADDEDGGEGETRAA